VVLRRRHARRDPRAPALDPRARVPGRVDGGGRPAGRGAPELRAARAARAAAGGPAGGRG
jgi:hypothetical protein